MSFTTFIEGLAPFEKSTILGPSWLKAQFPCETPGAQADLVKIWSAFLTGGIILLARLKKIFDFILINLNSLLASSFFQTIPEFRYYKKEVSNSKLY